MFYLFSLKITCLFRRSCGFMVQLIAKIYLNALKITETTW